MSNLDKLKKETVDMILEEGNTVKVMNLTQKKLEQFIDYANNIKNKNVITEDIKINLQNNYTIAILLVFYINNKRRFYQDTSDLKFIQQIYYDRLNNLTLIYLSIKDKIGKNIIRSVLINFQSYPEFNGIMKVFKDFLVQLRMSKNNITNLFNSNSIKYNLKNVSINQKINIRTPIKEQLQPIKSNVNQSLNNNESKKNEEYSNMLYRELDPKNKNHNRPLRKLYCEKKLLGEGKKIKNGIFKQNTKNYIECKDRTTITAKNMLNKGISPFNNINNENISVIKKSCKSNNSNISELKNTCVVNFFKEKQSAMGGSKKNK